LEKLSCKSLKDAEEIVTHVVGAIPLRLLQKGMSELDCFVVEGGAVAVLGGRGQEGGETILNLLRLGREQGQGAKVVVECGEPARS